MSRIAWQRLYSQHLEGPKFQRPEDVVSWFGAVQAQEYALAKWALGLRMEEATDAVVEQAFADGAILRTHVMRPTWHFVTPADIRWMLELTAPRVHAVNGTMYRRLGLDDTLLRRCDAIIARAVEGDRHLTRAELGAVLSQAGIDTADNLRLGYMVHHAELEGVICSGRRHGKKQTYALIAERAPQARRLARDEALAELTRRYFTSHGPATVKDFAWWSGLTVADVKAGLAMLDLSHDEIDGEIYWYVAGAPVDSIPPAQGHLLPVYDEFTIAYKNHSASLDPKYNELVTNRFFTSPFVLRGELIGLWRRTFRQKSVVIESAPFRPYNAAERDAFAAAGQRFGEFLGMPVVFAGDENQP